MRKVSNVYVILFTQLGISMTVNEYQYQKMVNTPEEYEFVRLQAA